MLGRRVLWPCARGDFGGESSARDLALSFLTYDQQLLPSQGKTSLILQYVAAKFDPNYKVTLGGECAARRGTEEGAATLLG